MQALAGGGFMGKVMGCVLYSRRKIDSIGESPQNPDGTIKGDEDDEAVTRVQPGIMDGVAVAGVGSAITTMVLTEGHIVDIASVSTMGLCPYAAYQKHKLNKLGGFRGQQNILRGHVNELALENNKLSKSIDGLSESVSALEDVEKELDSIASSAQTNVNRLVAIVKENGELQSKIKKALKKQVAQDVVQIVLAADRDGSFHLGKMEIEMMIIRMKALPAIDFDEPNFRKALLKHGHVDELSVSDMLEVLRNLQNDDLPEEENIFHLKPEQLLDEDKKEEEKAEEPTPETIEEEAAEGVKEQIVI